MQFGQLPDDWPVQRDTLRYLATHLLSQARFRLDGLFDLVPTPGGFGTPMVGPDRERVRLVGGSLLIERVSGADIQHVTATTQVETVAGNTLEQLGAAVGFSPDPDFWVGDDTPPTRDTSEPITLHSVATEILGDWYLLGQRSMDDAVASIPDAEASVGRLWPEHFDYGIDLAAKPGVRCNLGASAGDGFHAEPYMYLGPWDAARPGAADYWNAPFGAVLSFGELDSSSDPLRATNEFFMRGLAALRSG
jgi:hypothetical protein